MLQITKVRVADLSVGMYIVNRGGIITSVTNTRDNVYTIETTAGKFSDPGDWTLDVVVCDETALRSEIERITAELEAIKGKHDSRS